VPDQDSEPPRQFANVPTPQDLYPTSDIRFVMVELGKLGTKVDRLIQDVDRQGTKIDAVWHQISFVKGALWVLGGLFAIATVAVPIYFRMTNALYFRMTNALTRL
jgi:hypothetical protein